LIFKLGLSKMMQAVRGEVMSKKAKRSSVAKKKPKPQILVKWRALAGDGPGVYSDSVLKQLGQNSSWLAAVFPDDKLLYEDIRDAVNSVKDAVPPYNPYLYESLMADVSRLLDRCLAYRRECAALECAAVSRAMDYWLFGQISPNDATLNALLTDTSALVDTQKGQASSAQALNNAADATGLKAFAPSFGGSAAAATDAITVQNNKLSALTARLGILASYENLLQMQHTTPGHALNYAERRARVVNLIKQDVAEAYQKAIAARACMIMQLGLTENQNYAFPIIAGDATDVDFLDRFVMWARDVLRSYEIYCEAEVTFELIVPLFAPYWSDFTNGVPPNPPDPNHPTDPAHDKVLVAASAWSVMTAALGGGQINVSLKPALPAPLIPNGSAIPPYRPNARLRSIGLSAGVPNGVDPTFSWSGVIFLPAQPSPYDTVQLPNKPKRKLTSRASGPPPRPPVILGRIFSYRYDATPAGSSGDEVWNVDPTTNIIQIYIQPMALQGGQRPTRTRDADDLKDLKLHLRFVARPSPNMADWTGTSVATTKATRARSSRQ